MIKTIICIFIITIFFSACSNKTSNLSLTHKIANKEGIYSVKQAKMISLEELVKEVEHYPVIFVGDHHNTKKTHDFFESFLKELDKKNYNLNLANEWFTKEHNKILKDYTDNRLDGIRLKERRHWNKFTKYKWEYVEPLYEAVKANNGRLYGMNLSKEDRKKISLKKFEEMSKEEKNFYDSLDLNISAHKQLIYPYLNHCNKMPSKSLEPCEERMYRVQVSWDTYMANSINEIANKEINNKKDKLLVFAGALHIENKLGIPLRFSRINNLPFTTISNFKITDKKSLLKLNNNKADFVFIYK